MGLFGTAGVRGRAETRVTPALALRVGRAVAAVARDHGGETVDTATTDDALDRPEVVVGRDGRVSGPALAAAVEAGLASGGARVTRLGQLPTPALAYASQGRYGVMLTASHNPPSDNGIKLFADGVEFDRQREQAVEARVDAEDPPASWDQWTTPVTEDSLDPYLEAVEAYVRTLPVGEPTDPGAVDLEGLRIAVDCGNGMAAPATPVILRELGATVVTLNGNVDGHFPGRGSKPTPETLADLRAFIADANAGVNDPGHNGTGFVFGIAHDGDADRIVLVDADGEIVHEDTVLAILAEHYVETSDVADPVVVTTPNASARIDERVEAAGGRVERVRLGALHEGIAAVYEAAGERADDGRAVDDERVVDERAVDDDVVYEAAAVDGTGDGDADADDGRSAADKTAVVFAAEPWKHVHPAFGGWIDGVCSAGVLARLVATVGLGALREPVTERPYRKTSIDCPDEAKPAVMDQLTTRLPSVFSSAVVDTDHGVRLEFPDASWALVRPSGTEPYVRVYAESDAVDDLTADVREVVEQAVEATA